jgi:hypothetical protein
MDSASDSDLLAAMLPVMETDLPPAMDSAMVSDSHRVTVMDWDPQPATDSALVTVLVTVSDSALGPECCCRW